MSMNGHNETKDEQRGQEQASANESGEAGHSGEGAASAMAHMISQGQQHRHQVGEADNAAGGRRQ
jgi:hypothetical protein